MPAKKSYLTVTDQFCGAGGSSQGVRNFSRKNGGGVEVALALNHWKLAIETHNTNFPNTLHDCCDISATDPRRYPSTDMLITSPECTNQTNANGKIKPKKQLDLFIKTALDPAEERSRATMWDVCRFAEYHDYNHIVAENVVEARKWIMFDVWLQAMHKLGYNHKCCYLNSMHFHPCPQSRDRMYVVFWKKGNKAPDLNYYPKAWCNKCTKDISAVQSWKPGQKTYKYRTGYMYCCPACTSQVEPYYYAAFNIIDWSNPGRRIGDLKLVPNTMKRIRYGREKFWNDTITLTDFPLIVKGEYTGQDSGYVRRATDAMQTQSTRNTFGLVTPLVIEYNRTGKAIPANQVISTITSGGNKHGILMPFIAENKGKSNARSSTDALSTLTTKTFHGIVTTEAFTSFISYYNGGSNLASHILDATGTIIGTDRLALVSYKVPEIEDCYYRTFKPREVKLGMAFDDDYDIKGNSKEQVKQSGNAVTPPTMEWLAGQCILSLQ
jgi:DNA (cytosine-5)-methyltransferase 1